MAGKRGHGEGTIYRRKDGRWEAKASIGTDPVTGKIKRLTKYFKTRKEAQEWLAQVQHEQATGVFVEPTKITLGEWLDRWLEVYKRPNRKQTTYENYETLIRCHIKPALGHIPLQKLQTSDIQQLYNNMLQEKANWTVHLVHLILNMALKQAIKEQLIYRNVNEATELPPKKHKEITPLTIEQVHKFLDVAREDRLYVAFLVELATGLRRGELLALRWNDVDLENGVITVSRTVTRVRNEGGLSDRKTRLLYSEPKTEKSKGSVPVPESVLLELKTHKRKQNEERLFFGSGYQNNNLVFCTEDGRQLDPKNFYRRYKRLLQKANVPDVSFHALRHTFASLLLEAGEDMKTVQEILRHTRLSTTADIYTKVTEKLKKKAASKIESILLRGNS